jgi:3-oxoacyl-[acyl-carrier protein] reductase
MLPLFFILRLTAYLYIRAGDTQGGFLRILKTGIADTKNGKDTMHLQNKVCLVTGGTRGIGLAIARMLLAEGAKVVICGRSEEGVTRAVQELEAESPSKVKGKAADVSVYEDVRALFSFVDREFGGLDVLVNNAGIGHFAKVSEASPELWAEVLGTNLTGTFYCSREALFRFGKPDAITVGAHRDLDKPQGGYIVNISSLAGKNPFAGGAAYNASKFGVNGFSEALMLDSRYDNVRVTTVAPGSVATEFGGRQQLGGEPAGKDWRVWAEDVAEIVRMVLTMPERTMVSYVEVRPSRPPRK